MIRTVFITVLAALIITGTAFTQGKHGSKSEAEAMVHKAIAYIKANPHEKALKDISDPAGKFVEGDLYVFVYDITGKCVAHGGNPKMVGKDLIDLKDADGKAFVKERVEIARDKGKGWQNYKWSNPVTKQIEEKTAYVEKTGDFIVGCGAYK